MHVFIDGRHLSPTAASLAGAIDTAREDAGRRGRLVIEVEVDGRRLDAEELTPARLVEASGAREVRFTSASTGAFVAHAVNEAADGMLTLDDDQRRVARLVRRGELDAALPAVAGVLEGWRRVREALERSASIIGLSIDGVEAVHADGTVRAIDAIDGLGATLRDLRNALSLGDWATVADVMDGDLVDRSREWVAVLTHVAAVARTRDHAAEAVG